MVFCYSKNSFWIIYLQGQLVYIQKRLFGASITIFNYRKSFAKGQTFCSYMHILPLLFIYDELVIFLLFYSKSSNSFSKSIQYFWKKRCILVYSKISSRKYDDQGILIKLHRMPFKFVEIVVGVFWKSQILAHIHTYTFFMQFWYL